MGCQSCDPRSQRELYEEFKSMVMGTCRRYTGSKEEAEDVFQETFIRIFKSITQIKDFTYLQAWIRRTTINTAINYYHKQKRHLHAEEGDGQHAPNEDYAVILSQFTDEQLIGLINNLPDGYRIVFNMYEVEGFSHTEIAAFLNISEATSRSQLFRAKSLLKSGLKNLGILMYEKYA